MHVQVNVDQPVSYNVELSDDRVTIDPNRTVEEWVAYAKRYMTYCHDDFTNEKFQELLREPSGREVVRTVRRFRVGRGGDYTIEWAKAVREALNLDPVGFEHMAALANQHFGIWYNSVPELVFSPDLLTMNITCTKDADKPTMVGISGNLEARQFSVTPYKKFNGRVWFCGLVKAETTTS